MNNNEKGFVLVFVIAVVAALSLMTASMNFYYDNALKSTTRNSVYQQVKLASESGVQAAKNWLLTEMNKDQFSLLDIQNTSHIDNSNNQCLNRHGYTDNTKDIHFTKWIKGNLGTDSKFAGIQYEVFVQRYADNIRSLYFGGFGPGGASGGLGESRSGAYVRKFKDFPEDQFTVEMWVYNDKDDVNYNMHAWEYGRYWDVVLKVINNNSYDHKYSPRIGAYELTSTDPANNLNVVRKQWTHLAWVWDGGSATGNTRIYQNGMLTGTWDASFTNNDTTFGTSATGANLLPNQNTDGDTSVDYLPLVIGNGLNGFDEGTTGDTVTTAKNNGVEFQGVPWLGNITEVRIWSNSRTQSNIANNYRTRLTGSEPNLISYYKFNEGSGSTVNDNATKADADKNHLTVMGLSLTGDNQTKWQTTFAKYPLVTDHDTAPSINVPPGEDVAYYRILSCGKGPEGQLIPLESIVSAPVVKGDIGTEGQVGTTVTDYNFSSTVVPGTVEFSFYNDGSSNSIYMDDEDSIDITNIPSGWTVNQSFDGNTTPLRITPQVGITMDQFKDGLTNVFYKSCGKEHDCSSNPETYTPGIRRIKVDLNYTNPALNETHGFTKNLQAREKVILTPISWRIR